MKAIKLAQAIKRAQYLAYQPTKKELETAEKQNEAAGLLLRCGAAGLLLHGGAARMFGGARGGAQGDGRAGVRAVCVSGRQAGAGRREEPSTREQGAEHAPRRLRMSGANGSRGMATGRPNLRTRVSGSCTPAAMHRSVKRMACIVSPHERCSVGIPASQRQEPTLQRRWNGKSQ
mmetsp:Transcript_45170/g.105723  ORF Transcript_45170/g.105723 Transcript_45170/m.105723 type:complete len:175 (+) Transcript_45170:242-766(+)